MKLSFVYPILEQSTAEAIVNLLQPLGWKISLRGHGAGARELEDIRVTLKDSDGLLALLFEGDELLPQVHFEIGVAIEMGFEVLLFRLQRVASNIAMPTIAAIEVLVDSTHNTTSKLTLVLDEIVKGLQAPSGGSR